MVVGTPAADPSGAQVKLFQNLGRKGPTSIRYYGPDATNRNLSESLNPNDPPPAQYYTRDRDLGQTFTVPAGTKAFRLDTITVRLGPVTATNSLDDATNAPVFLQIFEVTGTPVINHYGTTNGEQVSSGYTQLATRHLADDYITGETYTTKLVATGGILPAAFVIDSGGNTANPTTSNTGTRLRFDLTATGGVILHPGRVYAFMVCFENFAPKMSLPLDNWDYLNVNGMTATSPEVLNGPYSGGHAIRREGRIPNPHENLDKVFSTNAIWSAFDVRTQRILQAPTTFGRPDVDTYRDLVFWIEGSDVSPSFGHARGD